MPGDGGALPLCEPIAVIAPGASPRAAGVQLRLVARRACVDPRRAASQTSPHERRTDRDAPRRAGAHRPGRASVRGGTAGVPGRRRRPGDLVGRGAHRLRRRAAPHHRARRLGPAQALHPAGPSRRARRAAADQDGRQRARTSASAPAPLARRPSCSTGASRSSRATPADGTRTYTVIRSPDVVAGSQDRSIRAAWTTSPDLDDHLRRPPAALGAEARRILRMLGAGAHRRVGGAPARHVAAYVPADGSPS